MRIVSTSDFDLSAFLLVRNHDIKGTRLEGRRMVFQFEKTPQLIEDVDAFKYSDPLVPAKSHRNAQRELKSLLYEGRML